MADLAKTIAIIFEGDDRVSSSINSISSSIDSFAGGVQDATQPIADLTASLVKMEAAAVSLAAAGLAYAVAKAGEFGDSFNEISTLFSDSTENVDQFKNSIIEYAQGSTQSIESINKAVYSAISAGTSYSESLKLLEASEKLSVAGKADLERTTVALASTLNAYGDSTDNATKYSDIFFQTVKLGQTTIPELASSLSKVTGIAASAGIPFETLSASIAALTATGIPTSEAITSLKAAISNIIKPSSEAQEYAAKLGISFDAAALKSKGFEGVLAEVQTATGGSIEKFGKLFGSTEALNSALILSTDKTGKFKEALDKMRNSVGSTEEAYKKMADNLTLVNQNLLNNLEAVLIKVGTPLLDKYGDVANAISEVFKAVGSSIDAGAFDSIYKALNEFGSDIESFFLSLAKNLPEALKGIKFDALIKSFRDLGLEIKKVFEAFFGNIDLSTADGLRKALQGIVDAFSGLTYYVSGVVSSFQEWSSAAGEAVRSLSGMDSESQKAAGSISGIITQINLAAGYVQSLASSFSLLSGAMATMATVDVIKLISGLSGVNGVLTGLGGAVAKIAGPAGLLGLAGATGYAAGSLFRLIPGFDGLIQGFAGWTDSIFNWTGTAKNAGSESAQLDEKFAIIQQRLRSMPSSTALEITSNADDTERELEIIRQKLDLLPQEKMIEIFVSGEKVGEVSAELQKKFPDKFQSEVQVLIDRAKLTEAKEDIKKEIPEKKDLELEAKLKDNDTKIQIEQLRFQAESIQSAFEYKAKVDVAEIQAAAQVTTAAFDSINTGLNSSSMVMSDIAGALSTEAGAESGITLRGILRAESERKDREIDLQEKLINEQVKYYRSKIEAADRGDALITVDGSGLQPHLEAIMWEILSEIQVRANEEGQAALLGITI